MRRTDKGYFVVRTTKYGICYKRTKNHDYWSKNKNECWVYSLQGAKKIVERLNNQITWNGKRTFAEAGEHYNYIEA